MTHHGEFGTSETAGAGRVSIEDPYRVPGLSASASPDEVGIADRRPAGKLRPNLNPGGPEVERPFNGVWCRLY